VLTWRFFAIFFLFFLAAICFFLISGLMVVSVFFLNSFVFLKSFFGLEAISLGFFAFNSLLLSLPLNGCLGLPLLVLTFSSFLVFFI
jgi:hypothetical protein